MTIKQTILLLVVVMTAVTTNGQTIKDYFIPDSTHNKASFYTPDQNGARTEMTRAIYYTKKGTTYDILNAPMFNGQPSAIQTMTVKFTINEVQMTKSISTNMFETNKKADYNPPRTILKMPATGQTSTWTYTDIAGDIIKCTATMTTVKIDTAQKKAIKVIEITTGLESVKTIKYYVKDIGLWETDIQDSNGTIIIDDKFDGLSYDPTGK